MIKGGEMSTNHSKNPVPFIVISDRNIKLKPAGELSNVAPTILQLLRLKKPKEMNKSSLIV
jgi:2,3-bisphosphoglycerate-independent phosphoglycerate mutase